MTSYVPPLNARFNPRKNPRRVPSPAYRAISGGGVRRGTKYVQIERSRCPINGRHCSLYWLFVSPSMRITCRTRSIEAGCWPRLAVADGRASGSSMSHQDRLDGVRQLRGGRALRVVPEHFGAPESLHRTERTLEGEAIASEESVRLIGQPAFLPMVLGSSVDPISQDLVRRVQPDDHVELARPQPEHVVPPPSERPRGRERLPLGLQTNEGIERSLIQHRDAVATLPISTEDGSPPRHVHHEFELRPAHPGGAPATAHEDRQRSGGADEDLEEIGRAPRVDETAHVEPRALADRSSERRLAGACHAGDLDQARRCDRGEGRCHRPCSHTRSDRSVNGALSEPRVPFVL